MITSIQKLLLKEKIGYSFGDFASVLFGQTISLHLIFFYTDVFGIGAKAAGFMILITRFWDGINDPIMGHTLFQNQKFKTQSN